MTLEIRELLPADAAAYRELMLEGYARHPEAFTATVAEREGLPLAWWEARTSQVVGAFAEGELAGVAGLERDSREKSRHRAKLFGMYVEEKSRHQGAGRAIVLAVLEKARRTPGLEVVYLTVVDTNAAARRLYEKCGFREFGHEPMAIAEGGRYLGKLHLWIPLKAGAAAEPPRAPQAFTSGRLHFRRLREQDLEEVLSRYAADAEVTKYLSWPRHRSLDDTKFFLELSDNQWQKGPVGPYLLFADGKLIGSTGLEFRVPYRATVGYALAQDAWGHGYATEALAAMVDLARELGAYRIETIVHPANGASARVLEKGGFDREGLLRGHTIFPNLDNEIPADVLQFGRLLG